jgi:hypothetical protein
MKKLTTHKRKSKQPDLSETMQALIFLTEEEINRIADDANVSVLEKTVARALQKGLEHKSLDNLEKILIRTIGRPREANLLSAEQIITAVYPQIIDTGMRIAESEEEIIP